jgi:hypothetical protein
MSSIFIIWHKMVANCRCKWTLLEGCYKAEMLFFRVYRPPPLANQSRSKSVGEQKWQNLRAVMALYTRLRKIKR